MKRYITLDEAIKQELKQHPELAEVFQKELLINAISRMIVDIRRKVRLTQVELAIKANTTQPVIARLESGQDSRMPSLDLLSRIATAAGAKLNISFIPANVKKKRVKETNE
jgi:transcriptional regulator with XRE-family HTH domain